MPAIMSYLNVRLVEQNCNNKVDAFICCPSSGVGYHTRPNKSIFIPVVKGNDDFAFEQSCPEIVVGAMYLFDKQAMHCYLSAPEYLLFVEMLAMAVGYEQETFDVPDVGLVNSHMFGATARVDDELPLMPLIAYWDRYPVFHGTGLVALVEQLNLIDRRIRQGDLKMAHDAWMHRKCIAHIDACNKALDTNGLVLLGR